MVKITFLFLPYCKLNFKGLVSTICCIFITKIILIPWIMETGEKNKNTKKEQVTKKGGEKERGKEGEKERAKGKRGEEKPTNFVRAP